MLHISLRLVYTVGIIGIRLMNGSLQSALPFPRTQIGILINSRQESYCQWTLNAQIISVHRLSVAMKCKICHTLARPSLDSDALICWVCGPQHLLELVWEVMLLVDDGTGQCLCLLEQSDISVLFQQSDTSKQRISDLLLQLIAQRCRKHADTKAVECDFSAETLSSMRKIVDGWLLQKDPTTTVELFIFNKSATAILQILVCFMKWQFTYEVVGCIARRGKLGGRPKPDSVGSLRVQKISAYGSSDYINSATIASPTLVFAVTSFKAVHKSDVCNDTRQLLNSI